MSPAADPAPPARWDAIVVAGGRASRLGGIDKTALLWHGRSLLAGVVAAASGSERSTGLVCVVGSAAELSPAVLRTVESPRWGGPAAAIVAGLAALAQARTAQPPAPSWVLVLAADLLRPAQAVAALAAAIDALPASTAVEAVVTVDSAGARQPLLAAYRMDALSRAADALATAENAPVKRLIGALTVLEVPVPDAHSADVDTPADAARVGIDLPDVAAGPAPVDPTG